MVRALSRLLVIALLASLPLRSAEEHPDSKPGSKDAEAEKKPSDHDAKPRHSEEKESDEEISETHHTLNLAGRELPYTARAGKLPLKDENKTKAGVFFVAYTLDQAGDPQERPLTFCFNGGPGSSSVWLHLGLFGPRRVLLNEDGTLPPPPFELVENDASLLDVTDLVFIDPISTGYSRPVQDENAKAYHGVEEDIRSVGEFIRLYTTRYRRWLSPKFLAGESYGTTRAAGLSGFLHNRYGFDLNGIILVSSVLNFQTISFNNGNDLPYILFLPSYAATAWFHQQLSPELQARPLSGVLPEVERFAINTYAPALLKGAALPDNERAALIQELARYTGLSPDYIDRANLRIRMFAFAKELLRSQRRTVGRYDSRMTGIDRDATGESFDYDPSYAAVLGPFTAAFNDYIRSDLKFESDLPYEILTGKVQPWNFGPFQNRYVDEGETLRSAMTENPYLRVFVANGFYDLATPYFATLFTFDHLQLSPEFRGHVRMGFYPAGHMMYIDQASRNRLRNDLAEFIRNATAR